MNLLDRVEQARNRGGDARTDRPEAVDELLQEAEQLGYENGQPLGNVDEYDQYPDSKEEYYWPEAGPLLASVVDSEPVRDVNDLSEELDFSATILADMCKFHNISIPRESDYEPSPHKDVPDGEGGTTSINTNQFSESFPVAYHLYVTLGMGVEELSTFLDRDSHDVRKHLNRHNLI